MTQRKLNYAESISPSKEYSLKYGNPKYVPVFKHQQYNKIKRLLPRITNNSVIQQQLINDEVKQRKRQFLDEQTRSSVDKKKKAFKKNGK